MSLCLTFGFIMSISVVPKKYDDSLLSCASCRLQLVRLQSGSKVLPGHLRTHRRVKSFTYLAKARVLLARLVAKLQFHVCSRLLTCLGCSNVLTIHAELNLSTIYLESVHFRAVRVHTGFCC